MTLAPRARIMIAGETCDSDYPPDRLSRRILIAATLGYLAGPPLLAQNGGAFDWQAAAIAPNTRICFIDRRGRPLDLAAFAGRPVLLNIWATWCAPCVLELPALDRLKRDFGNRLAVVALSIDHAGMPAVVTAMRRLSLRHLSPYLDGEGDVFSKLRLPSLPATLALSADGSFLQRRRGRVDWDNPAERKTLRKILSL